MAVRSVPIRPFDRRSPIGAILEPGELGTVDLRVADCVQGPIPQAVTALYGVPCHRAHMAQVFAIGDGTETCFEIFERQLSALALRSDLEFAEPITEDLVRPNA